MKNLEKDRLGESRGRGRVLTLQFRDKVVWPGNPPATCCIVPLVHFRHILTTESQPQGQPSLSRQHRNKADLTRSSTIQHRPGGREVQARIQKFTTQSATRHTPDETLVAGHT